MNCIVCHASDDAYCIVCGDPVCDEHLRVPDPAMHDELADYCVNCYAEAGYAEIYQIIYIDETGRKKMGYVDVKPGTNMGGIAMAAVASIEDLVRVFRYRKVERWI